MELSAAFPSGSETHRTTNTHRTQNHWLAGGHDRWGKFGSQEGRAEGEGCLGDQHQRYPEPLRSASPRDTEDDDVVVVGQRSFGC